MRKYVPLLIAAMALMVTGSAFAGKGHGQGNCGKYGGDNPHGQGNTCGHHHHPKPPPECEYNCSPPPPVDVCPNIAGVQTTVPTGYMLNSDHQCVVIPIDPPVVPKAPAGPNKDAFCYGTGVDSYAWYTPEEVVTFGWQTLHVAFVVPGVDWSGVMTNGFKPYCGKGTMTGSYVDNQGWWTQDGSGAGFVSFTNPNGTQSFPEHYARVTP